MVECGNPQCDALMRRLLPTPDTLSQGPSTNPTVNTCDWQPGIEVVDQSPYEDMMLGRGFVVAPGPRSRIKLCVLAAVQRNVSGKGLGVKGRQDSHKEE